MKKRIFPLGLIIILSSTFFACTPKLTEHPSLPEQNFAFRFEFGACYTDILDTFNGTFTKDLIFDPAITIPFQLSNEQMISVYQEMIEIDFFDYPDVFSIPNRTAFQTPAERYHIVVRNGNISKTLDWTDEVIEPVTSEADNLRNLFQIIMEMISASPEYKKLPEPKGGCA